jgi:hypothetical protein
MFIESFEVFWRDKRHPIIQLNGIITQRESKTTSLNKNLSISPLGSLDIYLPVRYGRKPPPWRFLVHNYAIREQGVASAPPLKDSAPPAPHQMTTAVPHHTLVLCTHGLATLGVVVNDRR